MDGPDALANYLMIHFQADLRAITEGQRGLLYFLFQPGVSGTLIAYDQAKTWVLMQDWNPDLESQGTTRKKNASRSLRRQSGGHYPRRR